MDLGKGKIISRDGKCFIIAEIGQNHQGDMDTAKQMILEAKRAGADCVKFQKSCLSEKFSMNALERTYNGVNSWGKTYGEHKRHLEFSEEQFIELKMFAEQHDIVFSSSAMDMISADFLHKIGLPFIKIGSGDSNNLPMIDHLASKGVPLVISTGMIDMSTVLRIYNTVKRHHTNFALLHCVSAYPTPYDECNLNVIKTYLNEFVDISIGYSGHELGISVTLGAVALGAKIIERHFTLDKTWKGTDHLASLLPNEFKLMVEQIRIVETALGTHTKRIVPSELPCMKKLQKSLATAKGLKKGHVIKMEDVKIKVTEPKGIDGLHFDKIVGQVVENDKKQDEPFLEDDFNWKFAMETNLSDFM